MNELDRRALLAGAGLATFAAATSAGPLNPPAGPVAPTAGPEPRTAINANSTPGTSTSLVRITQPGSYYLTGNLQAPSGWTGVGIEIAASDVTVDLMGFALLGVAGSSHGVNAPSTSDRLRVHNGRVRGWGGSGLNLSGSYHLIEEITSVENGVSGIVGGSYSVVSRCASASNAVNGYALSSGSIVAFCTAHSNTGDGFSGADLAFSCSARSSGDDGFSSCRSAEACISSGNTGDGFALVGAVQRCTATSNQGRGVNFGDVVIDSHFDGNQLGGISVSTGGSVRGCRVEGSGSAGPAIELGSRCYAGFNLVTYGTIGIQSSVHCTIEHNQVSLLASIANPIGLGIDCSLRSVVRNNHVTDIDGTAYAAGNESVLTGNTATNSIITFDAAAPSMLGPVVTTQAGMNAAVSTSNFAVS